MVLGQRAAWCGRRGELTYRGLAVLVAALAAAVLVSAAVWFVAARHGQVRTTGDSVASPAWTYGLTGFVALVVAVACGTYVLAARGAPLIRRPNSSSDADSP